MRILFVDICSWYKNIVIIFEAQIGTSFVLISKGLSNRYIPIKAEKYSNVFTEVLGKFISPAPDTMNNINDRDVSKKLREYLHFFYKNHLFQNFDLLH